MRCPPGVDVLPDLLVGARVLGGELAPGANTSAKSEREIRGFANVAAFRVGGRNRAAQNLRSCYAIRFERRIAGFIKRHVGCELLLVAGEPGERPRFDCREIGADQDMAGPRADQPA
jgi:hypothetical protein